ncbi:polyketide antibiotic transporter [Microbacterium sp. HD4P20]|uniref:ABC transporter permease n=1 Tax=Microbacterium sp. HD4P20 TaxID=2864874 RepID=UPI001C63F2A2|nr:polyketide antibiotic transporter [Microbacterium sp. HD4P20]MCP2635793.1 polyketide antibiotic transporter [Microbacterium sp. HD4P20]
MNGFGALLRLRARRDALQVTIWTLAMVLLAYGSSVGVTENFGTLQERTSLLSLAIANPVILLFRGLPSGTDEGAFIVFLVLPFLAMLAALMAAFLAVRHTRAEEESGRAELVAATPAGRWVPFAATLVHGVLACVVVGAGGALGLLASGLEVTGSLVTGAAIALTGVVFLAIGLLAAQLFYSARAANSVTVSVLIGTFLVGGVGNALGTPDDTLTRMTSSGLAWVSPFVWAENSRPFADDDPWPLLLAAAIAASLVLGALALQASRDVGAGVLAARPARAEASPLLSGPVGLVARLSAGALVAWAIGAAVVGALSTSLAAVVQDVASDNPAVEAILQRLAAEGSMDQGLIVTLFVMVGVLAACFGVQTVQRARQEETHGTAESALGTPVGRVRWLSAFLVVAVVGIIVIAGAAVAGAATALAVTGGEESLVTDALLVGTGQAVAAMVFTALTAIVFALAPRLTIPLGWALVLVAGCLALFGSIFGIDDDIVALSPFAAIPVPGTDGVDQNGLVWLVVAAIVGAAASLTFMRRRELAAGG